MADESKSDPNEHLRQALFELARGAKGRSDTARIRDVMDGIEAAIRAHVKREEILATLHQHGIKMTMNSFQSALSRIRKERTEPKHEPGSQEPRFGSEPESQEIKENRRQHRKAVADRYISDENPLDQIKRLQEQKK